MPKAQVSWDNVYDADRMLDAYREHIKTLKQNRFITGIHEIDKRIRGVAPGELMFIVARAGCYKTALLQNFLHGYTTNSAWNAVFFSLEMPVSSLTERYHSMIHKTQGRQVEESYSAGDGYKLEEEFRVKMQRLFVVPSRVSLDTLAQYVKLVEEKQGKVGVVGIDYLGLIDARGQNIYETMSNLARNCKTLAKTMGIPVIVIAQTSRKAGSGFTEVEMDMARDSGAIEEAADFVLGLFKEGDDESQRVICKILKNRKGQAGSSWVLDLDEETFKIGRESYKWIPPKNSNGWKE
jgi:replicative DNA helicase